MKMSNNQPIHEIRLGHVKCAIFANETQAGIRHNVKVSRLYKDGEKWASSQVFGRDDLPLLTKVSDLAHTWIFVETQNGLGGSENGRQQPSDGSKQDR
jgi:hypothetical protein